jgi:hypothetical protein
MANTSGRHFLQIPGLTNVPERVLRALNSATIDHRGPEFQRLGLEVLAGLKHTSTAVSDGRPPSFSAMPMAIGVVIDFGASDGSDSRLAPSAQPMPTAETTVISDPASSARRAAGGCA